MLSTVKGLVKAFWTTRVTENFIDSYGWHYVVSEDFQDISEGFFVIGMHILQYFLKYKCGNLTIVNFFASCISIVSEKCLIYFFLPLSLSF